MLTCAWPQGSGGSDVSSTERRCSLLGGLLTTLFDEILALPATRLTVHRLGPPHLALVHRETEATSELSAILTASVLATLWVVRRLGLTLGELDTLTAGHAEPSVDVKPSKME